MKKTKKGFTLVELVIVVAVMAVLVAVAIPTVSAITGTAKENVKATNAQTIESMIKLKEAEIVNSSSGSLGDLDDDAIADALKDAKLGITEGTYYYDSKTGSCSATVIEGCAGTGVYKITFSGNNSVTVE